MTKKSNRFLHPHNCLSPGAHFERVTVLLLGVWIMNSSSFCQDHRTDIPSFSNEHANKSSENRDIISATARIERNSKDGEAWLIRAQAYLHLDEEKEAAKDFEEAFKNLSTITAVDFQQAAHCYADLGDYQPALKYVDKSLSIERRWDAFKLKAEILLKLNRKEEAVRAYSDCLRTRPYEFWALYCRANCLMQMKKFDLALTDLNLMAKLRPAEPKTYALRAKVYQQLKDEVGVKNDLQKLKTLGAAWF
jgi:tetratricopeptide (TPR) repeat protein